MLPRLMGATRGLTVNRAQRDQRRSGETHRGTFGAATIKQAAYDEETISMLSIVLERAVAGLPREQRTDERKARLASEGGAAAARGERDPIQLYALALGVGPWEPSIGGTRPTSQPVWDRT